MKRFEKGDHVRPVYIPASGPIKYLNQKGVITGINGSTVEIQFSDGSKWYFRKRDINLVNDKRPAKRNTILTNLKNNLKTI